MNVKLTYIFVMLLITMVLLSCGGSKETVEYEPDPFPNPDVVLEEPDPSETLVAPSEPVTNDLPVKKDEPLVLNTIYFGFDRSDLTPEARAILAENARKLEENSELYIRIEGHCDERGTVEYNLALGERRALAARNYLVNYGISPGRITVISYGKERPVDTRHNEQAWAKNRRAEFVILNK